MFRITHNSPDKLTTIKCYYYEIYADVCIWLLKGMIDQCGAF